mmetsp:Transcript_12094/g.19699  ORF Transcript_12094/g.19699 Transcript_12094/m.19699 type:complete len:104 (-) Transcript_12094:156-467(-)
MRYFCAVNHCRLPSRPHISATFFQSPKMFERAITKFRRNSVDISDPSDDDESSSDDDDDDFGRPMSVHDIRREAAVNMRPGTAQSGPRQSPEKLTAIPRHTII